MAIDSPRIVAGPTTTRVEAKKNVVKITNTIPPQPYVAINPETGEPETIIQEPLREGQLLVYNAPNETALFVVVLIGYTLTWKRATAITGYIDNRTGKPFGI